MMDTTENPYQFDPNTDTDPNAMIAQQYGIPPQAAANANITRIPDVRQSMNTPYGGMPSGGSSVGPIGPAPKVVPDPPLSAYPFHQFLSDRYDSFKKGVGDEVMHPGQMKPSDYVKAVDDYANGPVKDMVTRQIHAQKHFTSEKAVQDAIQSEVAAY